MSTSASQKSYIFPLFLALFAMQFCGTFRVTDSLSVRNVASIILFLYVAFNIHKVSSIVKSIKPYFWFIFTYLFCAIVNGDFFLIDFPRRLLSRDLPSLAIFFAIPLLLRNEKLEKKLVYFYAFLYLANAIISIMQSQNSPIAWTIANTLNPSTSDFLDKWEEYQYYHNSNIGYSSIPGLIGDVVGNGYFIAVFTPLICIPLASYSKKSFIFSIITYAIGFVACYYVQQRMCFLLMITFAIYFCFFCIKVPMFFRVVIIIVGVITAISYLETVDLGRLNENSDRARSHLFQKFIDFCNTKDVYIGSFYNYNMDGTIGQHNCFLDVIVRGGIFSLIPFIFFTIDVIKKALKAYKVSVFGKAVAVSIIFYILYSLTHSTGLHCGDTTFWIPFGFLFVALNISKDNLDALH